MFLWKILWLYTKPAILNENSAAIYRLVLWFSLGRLEAGGTYRRHPVKRKSVPTIRYNTGAAVW